MAKTPSSHGESSEMNNGHDFRGISQEKSEQHGLFVALLNNYQSLFLMLLYVYDKHLLVRVK